METYCKLFLDTDLPQGELEEVILSCANARRDPPMTIVSAELNLDVHRNEDHELERIDEAFLYWRFFADVDRNDGVSEDEYIAAVRRLMEGLQARGISTVAACDFEDALPQNR